MVVPFDPNNSDIYRGLDKYEEYLEWLDPVTVEFLLFGQGPGPACF